MDFSQALRQLKQGFRVSREGWNGKGMYLYMFAGSNVTIPLDKTREFRDFIVIKDAQDKLTPCVVSQADLLAEDWGVVQ